jgi:hypothetical protein
LTKTSTFILSRSSTWLGIQYKMTDIVLKIMKSQKKILNHNITSML